MMNMKHIVGFAIALNGALGLVPRACGQTLVEDYKVISSGGGVGDNFGVSVSVDDGIIAVGASSHYHGLGIGPQGAAYLFDAYTGNELFELLADDGRFFDDFGFAVSLSGGVVVVGVRGDDDNGSGSGSAYIYDAVTGVELFKLLADDGASADFFGKSVATDGEFAVIGAYGNDDFGSASGSAYIFDVKTGVQLFKLLPDDGEALDFFGAAVGISNGLVVIGAHLDDDPVVGEDMGSVYVFNAASGAQLLKLVPENGIPSGKFGQAVAIGDGVVVVGSPTHGDTNSTLFGSAYIFELVSGSQLFELSPVDPEQLDLFGHSVAVADGVVVVGARGNDDNGINSGSAYLFESHTGNRIAKLLASDAGEGDEFGQSVGFSDGIAVVGGNKSIGAQPGSGAAYVFSSISGNECIADLTGEGTLNFFDVSAFLAAFAANDPIADFTGDNLWDFFDVSAFLEAFAAGCP